MDERRGEGCCERVAFVFLDEGGLNVGELCEGALIIGGKIGPGLMDSFHRRYTGSGGQHSRCMF